jgi:uncharacterized protein YkwD
MRCQNLSHTACGRDPWYWIERVGFLKGYWVTGENLAAGNGKLATVRGTIRAWLRSDLHRSVLFQRRFNLVGIGTVRGKFRRFKGAVIWVAHFGYHG